MKTKYLGKFEIDNRIIDDEDATILIPEGKEFIDTDTHCNWYDLNLFMRGGDVFHGVASESNTSAIGIRLNSTNDGAKLWRIM